MMLELFAITALLFVGDDPAATFPAKHPTAADRKLSEKWLAHRSKILAECRPLKEQAKKLVAAQKSKGSLESARADRASYELDVAFATAYVGESPPPPLNSPLTVGDIGTLPSYRFRLIQRLGKSEARVAIRQPTNQTGLDFVLGKSRDTDPEVEVVLSRFDLSKVFEHGKGQCDTGACFIVSKAKAENLADGKSSTAFVLEPYDAFVAQRLFVNGIPTDLNGVPIQ